MDFKGGGLIFREMGGWMGGESFCEIPYSSSCAESSNLFLLAWTSVESFCQSFLSRVDTPLD